MAASYWATSVLRSRISRRRALSGAAGLGAVATALSLVGCGGGGGDGKHQDLSGIVVKGSDTSSKAVKGGILKGQKTSDAQHFDPLSGGSSQIFDHTSHAVGAIGVVGDTERLYPRGPATGVAAAVTEAARGISRELGAPGWPVVVA